MIVNPKSGSAASKNKILSALDVFSRNGYDTGIYFTQSVMDGYNYILKHGEDFDIVLGVGGDGTINEVTNACMKLKKRPSVAYFPSGTMNDFGSNFSLTNNYEDVAKRIVQNNPQYFDLGLIDDKKYFNYVAGFGALTDVSYKTKRSTKETLGTLAYILEGIGSLPTIHSTKTRVKIDGEEKEIDVLFGLIFNGNRVAGMELFHQKRAMNNGSLNVLLVENAPSIFETVNYLALLTQTDNKYLHWYQASDISLSFDEDVSWTLDGEEYRGGKNAHIKVIHDALEMMC